MASLASEMNGLSDLLEAQVQAGMNREGVIDALHRSWLDRITSLNTKLSNAVSVELSTAIKDSPFGVDQKQALERAVLDIGNKAKNKHQTRANQKCHNLENFIPDLFWRRCVVKRSL